MRCKQCQMVAINGVPCHETGCPLAYRDDVRECLECGMEFIPQDRHQRCCDEACDMAYRGMDCEVIELDNLRPEGWDHV